LPDNSKLVEILASSSPWAWPIIIGFVLLASVTLSYMLIGVLVQIVQVIASTEKEKAMVGNVAAHLRNQWIEKGHQIEQLLTKKEFQSLLLEPDIALFLNEVGVDMLVLVDMSEMIYEDIAKEQNGLDFEHFVDSVLNMRGTNPVTVQDVKSQLRIMKRMFKESFDQLDSRIQTKFVKCHKQINSVRKVVLGEPETDDEEDEVPLALVPRDFTQEEEASEAEEAPVSEGFEKADEEVVSNFGSP